MMASTIEKLKLKNRNSLQKRKPKVRTVCTQSDCVIDIYSISGAHLTKGNGNVTLNSAVSAGVYVIKAIAADGTVTSAKMVIR